MTDPLRQRIGHWTSEGYRVVSETPTSAQLVRPKHFNPAEFLAMPIYLVEYLGQREQRVYLAVDDAGAVTESGSGTQVSRYRRAQQTASLPVRLFWAVVALVVVALVLLAVQAVTR